MAVPRTRAAYRHHPQGAAGGQICTVRAKLNVRPNEGETRRVATCAGAARARVAGNADVCGLPRRLAGDLVVVFASILSGAGGFGGAHRYALQRAGYLCDRRRDAGADLRRLRRFDADWHGAWSGDGPAAWHRDLLRRLDHGAADVSRG